MLVSQLLETAFSALSAELVTDVIVIGIAVCFWFAYKSAKEGKHAAFVQHAPTVMTSLGILGTFIGIVIGLLAFDTKGIEDGEEIGKSIASLLEGLKTAFITSVAGMTASIGFKALDAWHFSQLRQESAVKEEIIPRDIYEVLLDQKEVQESIRKSIAGNEESSLVGQIRLLRSDFGDFSKKSERDREEFERKLFAELRDFAELMAKSATEQVIEALKQVISDFNKNLTEQFGENFKQLNEAVHKLVHWQQQYMEQLEAMSRQYDAAIQSIGEVEASVREISERAGTIPEAMSNLTRVMQVNQAQIEELQRHLDAFVLMRDKATAAVPEIRQRIEEIGTQMSDGAKAVRVSLETSANSVREASVSLDTTGRAVIQNLGNSAKSMEDEVKRTVERILAELRQSVDVSLGGVKKQVEDAVRTTGEGVNAQAKALDAALQQELNTAMRNLGSALATIVEHMAKTYQSRTGQQL